MFPSARAADSGYANDGTRTPAALDFDSLAEGAKKFARIGLDEVAATEATASATSSALVTSGGVKITMSVSMASSARTISSARRYCSAVAEAMQSTGLLTAAPEERTDRSRCWVCADSSGTERPWPSQASAASTPGPPALPTMPTPLPFGNGWLSDDVRDVEQLLEGVDPNDSGLPEECVDAGVRCRHRSGVRRSATRSCAGPSGLDSDDGLCACDPAGDLGEVPRVTEGLEVEQDDVGAGVLLPVAKKVIAADVGLVADRDEA